MLLFKLIPQKSVSSIVNALHCCCLCSRDHLNLRGPTRVRDTNLAKRGKTVQMTNKRVENQGLAERKKKECGECETCMYCLIFEEKLQAVLNINL